MAETVTLTCAGIVEAKLIFVKPPDDVDYHLKTYTTCYSSCSRCTSSKTHGTVLY